MNFILRLIRPEIDDLLRVFNKLEARLDKVVQRHLKKISLKQLAIEALDKAKAEAESEIADTKREIERAKQIAANISALLDR